MTEHDADFSWAVRWIRADAIAMFSAALWAQSVLHGSWAWFFGLILAPDLSMMGYLFGRRAGAIAYNAGHMYAWPLALLAIGAAHPGSLTTTAALSWIAHVSFDRTVGYGFKLPTTFEETTLGPIGQGRRRRAVNTAAGASQ